MLAKVPGSGSASASASLLSLYISPPPPSFPFTFLLSRCATFLRVPSFPRVPPRCPLIPQWIPTGGPDSSMVSTLKSWSWATAVRPFFLRPLSVLTIFSRCWQDQPPSTIHSKQVRPKEHHFYHRRILRRKEGNRKWRQSAPPTLGHCRSGALSQHGPYLSVHSSVNRNLSSSS